MIDTKSFTTRVLSIQVFERLYELPLCLFGALNNDSNFQRFKIFPCFTYGIDFFALLRGLQLFADSKLTTKMFKF